MKTKKNNIVTLDQFRDRHYGKKGTAKRDKLEAGYDNFKVGALLYAARLEKGVDSRGACGESWDNKVLHFKN